ncbi:MAG: hypothetical protein E6291_24900, partial [Citrobacter freundii]|nr:hypothetical protein [Citrobacter freundii]
TLKMPAFEWVHVQLHQQKGMISLSPPTICNSAEVTNSSLCENTGSRLVLLNYAQLVDVGDVENHDKRCQKSTLIHPVSKWSIKTLYFRLLVSKSGFPHG